VRLIAKFDKKESSLKFCRVLKACQIDSHLEESENEFAVWVLNEDQKALAEECYRDFLEGKEQKEESILKSVEQKSAPLQNFYFVPLTRFFIFICSVIFLASLYQESQLKNLKQSLFPVFTKVQKEMMYDFPQALVYAEELSQTYEITKETKIESLPPEAKDLLNKIEKTPPWPGFYYVVLKWSQSKELLRANLFTDIKKGEVWRLVTPTFLHAEFLHILFNLLWLWMLGKMLEKNLKFGLYLLFVLIAAVITNTLQYLMTGPFFMGFSGVVSAMAGYIWIRKKRAPWEIYPIDFGTLIFLWIFIFGMLLLQIVAFFLEILHIVSFQLNIANTAHVSGVVLGMLLGCIKLFKRKM